MGRYPHLGRFQVEGKEDERIAREAMALTETDQFAHRTLDTLSGGERQRVFVARALAQQPRMLLLDEPTSNLDVLHQLMVLDLVRHLVDDGLTAVAAFHDLSMAARYCDRLVVMSGGKVVANGLPEDVLTPRLIETVFKVKAAVYRDPVTGVLGRESNRAGQRVSVDGDSTVCKKLVSQGRRSMTRSGSKGKTTQSTRRRRVREGLVIVNTGEDKGKTTAALGVIFRAWGRDFRIRMFQFIKHTGARFGEQRAAQKLNIPIEPWGTDLLGFPKTWKERRRSL